MLLQQHLILQLLTHSLFHTGRFESLCETVGEVLPLDQLLREYVQRLELPGM